MRRVGLLLGLFFVTAAVSVLPAEARQQAAAHRHEHGGAYAHTAGRTLYLKYWIAPLGQPTGYTTVVNRAMRAWYDTPTRVWPYPVTSSNGSQVDWYAQFELDQYWGMAINKTSSGADCWGVCTYAWTDIILNRSTLDDEQIFNATGTAVHEFGHALGLSHACGAAACPAGSARTIMQWGYLPYNIPQTHDINDVNGIYR